MDNLKLRNFAISSFKNFKENNIAFNEAACNLYSQGLENPAVTDMILREEIKNGVEKLHSENHKMLSELVSSNFDVYDEIDYFYFKNNQVKNKMMILTNCVKMKEAGTTLMVNWHSKATKKINIILLSGEKIKSEFDKIYRELYPRTYDIRQSILKQMFDVSDILKIYFK